MLTKVTHAIMPVVIVVCATVLLALRRIEASTALAMMSAAGVYGVGAVAVSGKQK